MSTPALLLFNKPYRVLTQFTSPDGKANLSHYIRAPGMRPAGRLDYDSEGLVLLTNSGALQCRLADPRWKAAKTYFVQVEGHITADSLIALRRGVQLNDGPTLPADVQAEPHEPAWLWPRDPPIRYRRLIATNWLRLTIREGRNRQVRRMTAAVGLPTLRLVRWSVGLWTLEDLRPGEYRLAAAESIEQFLHEQSSKRLTSRYRSGASRASRR